MPDDRSVATYRLVASRPAAEVPQGLRAAQPSPWWGRRTDPATADGRRRDTPLVPAAAALVPRPDRARYAGLQHGRAARDERSAPGVRPRRLPARGRPPARVVAHHLRRRERQAASGGVRDVNAGPAALRLHGAA